MPDAIAPNGSAPPPAPASPTTPAGVTTSNKKQGRNFTPEEDKQLAKSWVRVSEDPIRSNNQKASDFWARVLKDFTRFSPGPRRDTTGLTSRWKLLQKAVLKFCALHDRIEKNPASGSSPEDWITHARQQYYDQENKHFVFDWPWHLL
ncbi:hypothetical protein PTTG_06959, partial [Puccinia triticina 1-1 BBBD Race 1]